MSASRVCVAHGLPLVDPEWLADFALCPAGHRAHRWHVVAGGRVVYSAGAIEEAEDTREPVTLLTAEDVALWAGLTAETVRADIAAGVLRPDAVTHSGARLFLRETAWGYLSKAVGRRRGVRTRVQREEAA